MCSSRRALCTKQAGADFGVEESLFHLTGKVCENMLQESNQHLHLHASVFYIGQREGTLSNRAVNLWVDSKSIQFTIHWFLIRFRIDCWKIQNDSI